MRNFRRALPFILVATLLQSCFVNRHTVGDGPVGRNTNVKTYSRAKQVYLFWGGLSLGQANPALPPEGVGYQIKSVFNGWDGLISGITGGLVSTRTVKIKIFKDVAAGMKDARQENAKKAMSK